jgi:hypothetical protein
MARGHTAQFPAGARGPEIRSIEELYHIDLERMTAYIDERAGIKTYVTAEAALRLAYFRRDAYMPTSAAVKRVHISRVRAMRRESERKALVRSD